MLIALVSTKNIYLLHWIKNYVYLFRCDHGVLMMAAWWRRKPIYINTIFYPIQFVLLILTWAWSYFTYATKYNVHDIQAYCIADHIVDYVVEYLFRAYMYFVPDVQEKSWLQQDTRNIYLHSVILVVILDDMRQELQHIVFPKDLPKSLLTY